MKYQSAAFRKKTMAEKRNKNGGYENENDN